MQEVWNFISFSKFNAAVKKQVIQALSKKLKRIYESRTRPIVKAIKNSTVE